MDQDTKEAAKSGLKVLENVTDVFNKLAGPVAEELGQLMADKVRLYRARNFEEIMEEVREIFTRLNADPKAIPPRLFLPAIESASLEDDPNLQKMWAALLANASVNEESVPPSFLTVLQQLTPGEATILDAVYRHIATQVGGSVPWREMNAEPEVPHLNWTLPPGSDLGFIMRDLERLGLIRTAYEFDETGPLKFALRAQTRPIGIGRGGQKFSSKTVITWFGLAFLQAVHAPQSEDKSRNNS